MSDSTARVLRCQAVGVETVNGVVVTPTRRLYGRGTLIPSIEVKVPYVDRNSFFPHYLDQTELGIQMSRFQFAGTLNFEDMPFWGRLLLGVTPAPTLIQNLYQWLFTPDPLTPSPMTTWQWFTGTAEFTAPYCLCERFLLNLDGVGGLATVAASFVGRPAVQVHRSTPSFTTDSTREATLGATAKVYLDPVTGAFGGSQVVGQVSSISVEIVQPPVMRWYDANTLTFGDLSHGPRQITVKARLRFTSTAEITNWRTHTERLLRLHLQGSSAGAGLLGYGLDPYGTSPYGSPSWYHATVPAQAVDFDAAGVWSMATLTEQGPSVLVDYQLLPRFNQRFGFDCRLFAATTTASLNAA